VYGLRDLCKRGPNCGLCELEPAPLSAEIADRLAALECSWMDEEQTTLAGTVGVDVDAVKL
jgi:hypothetical protein